MPNTVRVTFIQDPELLQDVAGLELPTIEPRSYPLLDDDEKVCRIISEEELEQSYVDNHIDTFQMRAVDWLTLDVDKEKVHLTYHDGTRTAILLGSIGLRQGPRAEQYAKSSGLIYPIDAAGALIFNQTTTPMLTEIRTWYLNEARRVNDQRLELAELAFIFGKIMGAGVNLNIGDLPDGHLKFRPGSE